MNILAIDPGNIESAYVLINDDLKPIDFGKVPNIQLREMLVLKPYKIDCMVIEMIASYGMAVGVSVFETCLWIGRFWECGYGIEKRDLLYRKDVKMHLCHSMKAKDSNIRQALIDRFGEVGTKKNPGWFYGFKADIWAAYAVAVTYADKLKSGEIRESGAG